MPSANRAQKPSIPITKVPSIKELSERLGFQHADSKNKNFFSEASHAWRKSYQTSSGIPGTELLHWNDPLVQLNLKEMSEKFLEETEKEAFWSQTGNWNQDSNHIYPEKKSEIIELLKQVFWKQNQYSANNKQYMSKTGESRDESCEKSTPISHGAPISETLPRMGGSSPNFSSRSASPAVPRATPRTKEPGKPPFEAEENETEGSSHNIQEDVFSGPDDLDQMTVDSILSNASLIKSTKHPRKDQLKSTTQNATLPKKRKRQNIGESPRRTARKRVTLVNLDYGSAQEFEDLLSSAEVPRPKARKSIKNTSQRRPHRDSSGNIQKSKPIATEAQQYSAPFATMIATSIADTEAASLESQLYLNAGQQDEETAFSEPLGHKLVQQPQTEPQTEPQDQAQLLDPFDRPLHDSITSPELNISDKSPSLIHTDFNFDQYLGISSPHQMQNPLEQSDEFGNLKVSNASSHPSYGEIGSKRNPPTEHGKVSQPAPATETVPSSTQTNSVKTSIESHEPQSMYSALPNSNNINKTLRTESISSKARSKIQVPLWIITRQPRYTEERWDEGKFQGRPLSVFIEELTQVTGRDYIERLKLTLRTPTQDTKVTVVKGAEDSWESTKKRFAEKLREATAEAKRQQNENPTCEILIEPFYEQNSALQNSVDEVEDEFEF